MNSKLVSVQAPRSVVMIRPHHFTPNPATAEDNAFQSIDDKREAKADLENCLRRGYRRCRPAGGGGRHRASFRGRGNGHAGFGLSE